MNKVYVVERDELDNPETTSNVIGVFTTLILAEECIRNEKKKMKAYGGLTPDFTFWIHDFVLNEGSKDEHQ